MPLVPPASVRWSRIATAGSGGGVARCAVRVWGQARRAGVAGPTPAGDRPAVPADRPRPGAAGGRPAVAGQRRCRCCAGDRGVRVVRRGGQRHAGRSRLRSGHPVRPRPSSGGRSSASAGSRSSGRYSPVLSRSVGAWRVSGGSSASVMAPFGLWPLAQRRAEPAAPNAPVSVHVPGMMHVSRSSARVIVYDCRYLQAICRPRAHITVRSCA